MANHADYVAADAATRAPAGQSLRGNPIASPNGEAHYVSVRKSSTLMRLCMNNVIDNTLDMRVHQQLEPHYLNE